VKRGAVGRVGAQALHLRQLLDPRLRLARSGTGPEAGDEALQAFDLRLLALDRPAQGQLAGGAFAAPLVPGPGEELAAPALELQH
jgi:hypothetical protein